MELWFGAGRIDTAEGNRERDSGARRLATLAAIRGHRGSIHVSGCGKGCARSAPADLVLVGRADGRYGLIRYGIASDDARRSICAESFDTLFRETIDA